MRKFNVFLTGNWGGLRPEIVPYPRVILGVGKLVTFWLVFSISLAAWADTANVRIVDTNGKLELDRELPASTAFTIEYYVRKADVATEVVLFIQPEAIKKCPLNKNDEDDAPSFVLLPTSANSSVLSAKIPPLQAAQKYCIMLRIKQSLTKDEARKIAGRAVRDAWSHCSKNNLSEDTLERALVSGVVSSIDHYNIEGDLKDSPQRVATMAADSFLSSPEHHKYLKSVTVYDTNLKNYESAENEVEKQADETAKLAGSTLLASPRKPFIVVDDRYYEPSFFVSNQRDHATLQAAIRYLNAAMSNVALPARASYQAWIDGLTRAMSSWQEAGKQLANRPLPPPTIFGIWTGEEFIDFEALKTPASLDGRKLRHAAKQIRELDVVTNTSRNVLIQSLLTLAEKQDNLERAQANLQVAKDNQDAEQEQAKQALISAVAEALRMMQLEVAFTKDPTHVRETTANPNNYASLDVGFALALPALDFPETEEVEGESMDAWLVPYLGLNIYLQSVERAVPLSEQIGGIRNRLSFTLGFALDEPKIRGRQVQGFLLGKMPLIAVGLRLLQYTRLSTGLLFYEVPSRNPAETRSQTGLAGFLSLSLDLDLITWVRGAAKGYGGF